MHFGFALELPDIDLWNTDLLDTHLGLLNPEISIQISPVSILFVSIKSLRGLQDMSSRHLQDVFSVRIFRFPRRLQDVLEMSSRRLARGLQDVFKRSSRRFQEVFKTSLQEVLEDVKLLPWRRVEDVFRTCLEDVFKTNKCLLGNITNIRWFS